MKPCFSHRGSSTLVSPALLCHLPKSLFGSHIPFKDNSLLHHTALVLSILPLLASYPIPCQLAPSYFTVASPYTLSVLYHHLPYPPITESLTQFTTMTASNLLRNTFEHLPCGQWLPPGPSLLPQAMPRAPCLSSVT